MEMSLVSMMSVRPLAQAGEQRALLADAVDDRAAGGQRVAAARLLEAPHQSLVGGLEEDERVLDAALVQLAEQLLELAEVLAAAHVADDGHPVDLAALAAEEVDQRRHELRRQVVDAEPAGVLERVHGLRLAGPREAGDDHELQGLRSRHGLSAPSAAAHAFERQQTRLPGRVVAVVASRPSFLMTRWHGRITGSRLRAMAEPTAR